MKKTFITEPPAITYEWTFDCVFLRTITAHLQLS